MGANTSSNSVLTSRKCSSTPSLPQATADKTSDSSVAEQAVSNDNLSVKQAAEAIAESVVNVASAEALLGASGDTANRVSLDDKLASLVSSLAFGDAALDAVAGLSEALQGSSFSQVRLSLELDCTCIQLALFCIHQSVYTVMNEKSQYLSPFEKFYQISLCNSYRLFFISMNLEEIVCDYNFPIYIFSSILYDKIFELCYRSRAVFRRQLHSSSCHPVVCTPNLCLAFSRNLPPPLRPLLTLCLHLRSQTTWR